MPKRKCRIKSACQGKLFVIRWIDKNGGRLLCFFLTLHRKFFGIFVKSNADHKKPSKILFIKLVEQGAITLAYPALKRAKGHVGKENLYFLVFREHQHILDILNVVSAPNILLINPENPVTFIYSVIKAIRKIRKERIDTVIDMEFFSRVSAIISYLSGANKRVGLHQFNAESPYRGDLFTHKLAYNPYLHTSIFFVSLVEALNHNSSKGNSPMIFEIPEITNDFPCFLPAEDDKKSLIKKIEEIKKTTLKEPIIILNPKIRDQLPVRKWPEENFIELGRMILEKFPNAAIIITGDFKEKEEDILIASRIGKAVSLAGNLSLRELFTLYSLSQLLVTSDSGPAIFSTLTPVKSIVLFGPETPILYGGLSENTEIMASNLICSPCVNVYNQRNSPCKSPLCLKSIKVEDVFERVKNLLS